MRQGIYESSYQDKNHFSFGKNWSIFLKSLDEDKISEAKQSLSDFFGGSEKISGKTFVDVGSGSGLFSLSAYRLGASRVLSVDIDDFSLECTKHLCKNEGAPKNWIIQKGSALDDGFIRSLGEHDIVYSWGVLHHTGNMWKAIENTMSLVKSGGVFYIAIYNKNEKYILEGTSTLWVKLKKIYNSHGSCMKKIMEAFYIAYYFSGLLAHGINPVSYVKKYATLRGMDFFTDIKDWLGGYPYEFASVQEIDDFFSKRGFELKRVQEVRSLGCNEFLFERKA